eukprot:2735792-Amphidinium_carterae.1
MVNCYDLSALCYIHSIEQKISRHARSTSVAQLVSLGVPMHISKQGTTRIQSDDLIARPAMLLRLVQPDIEQLSPPCTATKHKSGVGITCVLLVGSSICNAVSSRK